MIEWLRSERLPPPRPEWASFGATKVIPGFGTVFSSLFISAVSTSRQEDPQ